MSVNVAQVANAAAGFALGERFLAAVSRASAPFRSLGICYTGRSGATGLLFGQ
jgi:hypothetical protein